MEIKESDQAAYQEGVVKASRHRFAFEAKMHSGQSFLLLDESGQARDLAIIPDNLHFLAFGQLEQASLVKHSLDRVHFLLPLGHLHGNLAAAEIIEKKGRAPKLFADIYPALKPDGQVTLVDYFHNQEELEEMLDEAGFIPVRDKYQRYPAGPDRDNPLSRFAALKP